MNSQTSPPPVIAQAKTLAEHIIADSRAEQVFTGQTAVTIMDYRQNALAESYQHGQTVARILESWHANSDLQAAGLLHSFVYKGAISTEQVAAVCNQRTADLCHHYCDTLQQATENRRRGRPSVIKRTKLYMAAYQDPELAFLGVAGMWDHFMTARHSNDPILQRVFVNEAQEVMIPLLEMLGMWKLKTEVEAWVTQYHMSPQVYEQLAKRLSQSEATRTEAFELFKSALISALPKAEILFKPVTVLHIYNPSHPEKVHHEPLNKLTVDVQVDTEPACYQALRWVNHFWQPVEYKLVDHIGMSKLNGYRCLETTVLVPLGNNHVRAHVNIYTKEMKEINQWGIAALEIRDRQQAKMPRTWWAQKEQGFANICTAPLGTLPDILYVFTPHGQLFRFARGSTVVDFAYHLHSEIAHQCKRFKINGEAVGPATILHHLDLVELERDPHFAGPNRTWLHAARTNRAKSHIERFLKRQQQGQIQGREVIDTQLRELSNHYRIDIPNHRIEQTLNEATRRFNYDRTESLLADIALGRVPTAPILHPLFSEEVARQIERPKKTRLRTRQMQLAQCCKPRPGDEIIGRARYLRGEIIRLKIHQADCERIATLPDAIPLKWQLQPRLNTLARLEITALDKNSLLQDALAQLSTHYPKIIILKVEAIARNGTARLNFTVEAQDQPLIDILTKSFENLPGHNINEVRQMRLTFSEREELVKPAHPVGFNPYRRQPVKDRDMFFGRTEQMAHIQELLRTGAGAAFVQGQKRVGKTSLLLYLKKYYLNRQSKIPVFIDFQLLGSLRGPNFFYEIASAVYNDLQAENQLAHMVEPPLKELFARDPARQLADYLKHVQSFFGFNKLVLLIDEFSRTIDAFQENRIDDTLFHQWRGVIQATAPEVSYVMVVQEQTYNHLRLQIDQLTLAPIWHLLELGETIRLSPLNKKDAHQLIKRPTSNHIEYSPEALNAVWRLTGGSPFLIHAFCFSLVRHMAHHHNRLVEPDDVEATQVEFMHPNESIFAHLLHIIHNISHAASICHQLAITPNTIVDTPVTLQALNAFLPQPAEAINGALQQLKEQHILIEPAPNHWQFAGLLFARWLATNRVLE